MTKLSTVLLLFAVCCLSALVHGWSGSLSRGISKKPQTLGTKDPSFLQSASFFARRTSVRASTAAATSDAADNFSSAASPEVEKEVVENVPSETTSAEEKKLKRREQIRNDGGRFTFNTKYGALNPYGICYGLTAIALGIPWLVALITCQFLYFITGGRIDRLRRIPVSCSHIWGVTLMHLTRQVPKIDNMEVLTNFYKKKTAAMFCSNHNSWMDIPYLGYTIGFRNYKLVSKAELGKVPILGKAIKVGGNVMLDRSNRRSQLKTLKDGIQLLKDKVHLCTFPEGTRSRSGRLAPFKNGAFKMAHKNEAPVVPVSIVGSGKVHPSNFMFPCRTAKNAKVVVHEPVESKGKTEKELADAVRESIIKGLPEDQKPL